MTFILLLLDLIFQPVGNFSGMWGIEESMEYSMGYFWGTFGVLLEHFWENFGVLLEHFWSTFGILLEYILGNFEIHLEYRPHLETSFEAMPGPVQLGPSQPNGKSRE